jgi:hypothetical protein
VSFDSKVEKRVLDDVLARPERWVWGYATCVLLTAFVVELVLGLSVALLVLAGGSLVCVIGLLWSSLHHLAEKPDLTLEEALNLAPPTAEEEQKRAILRALKDLEFERSLGKISEQDYASLSRNYRDQAKALISALDRTIEPLRAEIEADIATRLTGTAAPVKTKKRRARKPETSDEPRAAKPALANELAASGAPDIASEPAPPSASPTCRKCETLNDSDARFCKGCGAPLEVE